MTEMGRRILIGLAILAVALVLYVASPFAGPLLFAAVLAGAMSPLYERLAAALGQRRTIAGALFVTGVVFVVLLPIAGLIFAVAQQADDAFGPMRATFQERGINGVIEELPEPLPVIAREVMTRLPRGQQQIEELVKSLTGRVLGGVGYVFLTTGGFVFNLGMMLVAFFFLLVDGPMLVRWIIHASPLTDEQMKELLDDFRDVSIAVLVGSVGTALVQTLVATIGFWIAGAKHALLLAAATFIAAFIPVVGAGSVVVASAVILYFTGHPGAALFLGIWGIGVVSSIDNVVKPLLMRGKLEINTGITFFALLGGAAVFGPVGLLAGPLIVAFFLAVVRMCHKELGQTAIVAPPPTATAIAAPATSVNPTPVAPAPAIPVPPAEPQAPAANPPE
jgi:predicted PurR-regulated permease PerM